MKKVLVLLIAFAILGGAVVFAEGDIPGSGSTLQVFGFIPGPEKVVTLSVEQLLNGDGIDLIGDESVQSDGGGYAVGEWTLSTKNHTGDEGYTLAYTYGDLASVTTGESIGYMVYEYANTGGVGVAKEGLGEGEESSSLLNPASGTTSMTRTLKVKLTSDPAGLAPATDFTSTITLDLTANN